MKKIVTGILLVIIFTLSILNLNIDYHTDAIYGAYITIIILFLFHISKLKIHKKLKLMDILLSSFMFFGIISSVLNTDYSLLFSVLIVSLLLMFKYLNLSNQYKNINKIIFSSIFIAYVIVTLNIFFELDFSSIYINSFFYNSNAFGVVVSTLLVIIFGRLIHELKSNILNKNKKISFWNGILILFVFLCLIYFLFTSYSRTSFISVFIILIIGIAIIIINLVRAKITKFFTLTRFLYFISFVSIFILSLYLFDLSNLFQENILDTFLYSLYSSSGLLEARTSVWIYTFENISFFGQGSSFYESLGIGAHNTFIAILGKFGLFTFFFFILINIKMLFDVIIYVKNNPFNHYNYSILFSAIFFIFTSMGEDMYFKTSMIIFFISYSVIIPERAVKRL